MNKKISKILVLSHSYIRDRDDYAGLFIHTLNKSLLELEYNIMVISPHAPGLKTREKMDGVDVIRFRYMFKSMESLAYRGNMHDMVKESVWKKVLFGCFLFAFLSKTVKMLITERIGLIHAHWWFPGGFIAYCAFLLLRVPYVITIHGTDAHIIQGNVFLTWLFRIVLGRSHYVVVGSEYLRDILKSSLSEKDLQKLSIDKIPMPVEMQHFDSAGHRKGEDNAILTVARLTAQKNLKILIRALVFLRDEGVHFTATIIGDGPLKGELSRQISRNRLEENIVMLHSVKRQDLLEHYRKCTLFVLPSVREGLGLVLAEALLMGKTVIASNSGGGTEIIEDGVSGILFDPSSARKLAMVIKRLIENPELAENLAKNGLEKARIMFSPESVGEKYSRIYQNQQSR